MGGFGLGLRLSMNSGFSGDSGGAAVPVVYPLDNAGALPAFAYSTKKLRADYAGPALRVVRTSDSATLDVGFTGQSLNEAALLAFISGTTGRVDIWYDQSGNGNHATQTIAADRPNIDPEIKIGGTLALVNSLSWMNLPAGLSTSSQSFQHFMVNETLTAGAQNQTMLMYGTGATMLQYFQQFSELYNNVYATFNRILQNRPCLYEMAGTPTSSAISQDGETQTAPVAPALITLTGGYIGYMENAGYRGQSYSAAHIGYSRNLSGAERTALRSGLRSLYSLAPDNVTKRVLFTGDSITATSNGTYWYGYPKMAQRLLPTDVAVYNFGRGGNQTSDAIANHSANNNWPHATLAAYSDTKIVFVAYGTNDISIGGKSTATIYADLQTFCGMIRADGAKAVIATVLPSLGMSGAQQTIRTDLNALIRANWASFADGLCDFAADPTIGPQAASANAALYPDGLHPSRLGYSYLAPIAAAAIAPLL